MFPEQLTITRVGGLCLGAGSPPSYGALLGFAGGETALLTEHRIDTLESWPSDASVIAMQPPDAAEAVLGQAVTRAFTRRVGGLAGELKGDHLFLVIGATYFAFVLNDPSGESLFRLVRVTADSPILSPTDELRALDGATLTVSDILGQ